MSRLPFTFTFAFMFPFTFALPNAGAAESRDQRITAAAERLGDSLVACRRDLHMHPELSNREERTARLVAERLRALGLDEVRTGVGRHGVTALVRGGRPGPVVAVRADMDALPIDEPLRVPYRSQIAGVKHACGHDLHTTVLLGVAEVLAGLRAELPGTVKLIFQGAEEGPPAGEEGGARLMVKERALEAPRPQAIFGLHSYPWLEAGQIGYAKGPAMATADRFRIAIHGKASHGAAPQLGVDAVTVAAEAVTALQTIRSRRIDPSEPMVLTLGTIQGGSRFNIIADEVRLEGTLRTFDEEVRARAHKLMHEVLKGVTLAHGASYELSIEELAALTANDENLVEESLPALRRVVGQANLVVRKPMMAAEDFAYFSRVVPGFYFWLGVGNRARGIVAPLHTPEFDVDERALVIGVKAMSTLVADYLERHAAPR
jgi:amidohydrolase